jgi:uncharacterized protein involved in type VI secretion and phage assembly
MARWSSPLRMGGDEFARRPQDYGGSEIFPGLYRGVVEDVNDPERRGRLRVRVGGVHSSDATKVPTRALLWAEPAFAVCGPNYGAFMVPYVIGSPVYVMFIGGDRRNPVWFGGWYGQRANNDSEAPTEVWENENGSRKGSDAYPKRWLLATPLGHMIEMSDEPGEEEIVVRDHKGNYVHFDSAEGRLDLRFDGDLNVKITGDITVTAGNDIELNASDKFTLRAKKGDHAHPKTLLQRITAWVKKE